MTSALNLEGVLDLGPYHDKVYSQNGEDGIIAELIRRIDPMKYFVEFGVENGLECNTRLLASLNWGGIQLEGRKDCFVDLCALNAQNRQRVHSLCEYVTLDNLESVFAYVPPEFGVLSIDVDGNDLYLFERMARIWRPSIVCVELNTHFDPYEPFAQPYNAARVWDGVRQDYGASLRSMTEMAHEQGYVLVGREKLGVNAFYVHERHCEALQ